MSLSFDGSSFLETKSMWNELLKLTAQAAAKVDLLLALCEMFPPKV